MLHVQTYFEPDTLQRLLSAHTETQGNEITSSNCESRVVCEEMRKKWKKLEKEQLVSLIHMPRQVPSPEAATSFDAGKYLLVALKNRLAELQRAIRSCTVGERRVIDNYR